MKYSFFMNFPTENGWKLPRNSISSYVKKARVSSVNCTVFFKVNFSRFSVTLSLKTVSSLSSTVFSISFSSF